MSIAGRINIENYSITSTRFNKLSNYFVNVHNFLSSTCEPLGVIRRACYYGTSGNGMDYWDGQNPAKENAWAVFEFTKAEPKFWALVQWSGTIVIDSHSTPTVIDGSSLPMSCIAISFASLPDGTSPWNGTTSNTGSDYKGTPIWTTGSHSRVYCFPRSNNTSGSHVTEKSNMAGIYNSLYDAKVGIYFNSTSDWINLYATEESFFTVQEMAQTQVCHYSYFGKYIPIEGLNPEVPYYQLYCPEIWSGLAATSKMNEYFIDNGTNVSLIQYGSLNGTLDESLSSNAYAWARVGAGGIAAAHSASDSLVRRMAVGMSHLMGFSEVVGPNLGLGSYSANYEEFQLHFFAHEPPARFCSVGYLGTSGDLKFTSNSGHGAISVDRTKISLMVYPSSNNESRYENCDNGNQFIITPWTGSVEPFANTKREGYDFVVL